MLLTIRDRLVVGQVEAAELQAAEGMFLRLVGRIDETDFERPVHYAYPEPATRTLGWMAKQAVHEVHHHLGDMHENVAGGAGSER